MYVPSKSGTQYSIQYHASLVIKNYSSDQLAAQTGGKAHSLQKSLLSDISAHVKLFQTSTPLLYN